MKKSSLALAFFFSLTPSLVFASEYIYSCVSNKDLSAPPIKSPNVTIDIIDGLLKNEVSFIYADGSEGRSYGLNTGLKGSASVLGVTCIPNQPAKTFVDYFTPAESNSFCFEENFLTGGPGGLAQIQFAKESPSREHPQGVMVSQAYDCGLKK